jgi:predicted pyridoxine 5'-phosphate oxidase superfamily flavin-nucleotide-binding protein
VQRSDQALVFGAFFVADFHHCRRRDSRRLWAAPDFGETKMGQFQDRSKINQAIKTDIENSVLCWLATVDTAGVPNVSPKEIFDSYNDDRIVIADIASSNSVRNIRAHPAVCVSFIDVFRQRGFKIVGTATIIPPEADDFPVVGADLLKMAGDDFPIRNVISIEVGRISRIWAPSYSVFPDRSETDQMRSAYRTYGVLPAIDP